MKSFTGRNFETRTLRFFVFGSLFCLPWFWFVHFYNIRKFCASSVVPNFCQSLNGSPVKFHLSPIWNASEVTILELECCGFLHFEVYLVSDNFMFLFFSIWKFCAPSVDFKEKNSKFKNIYIFLFFFLKRIRRSKYKQQRILKVLISYKMQKFAMLFLQNCDLWSVFYKHQNFEFFKKTRKLSIIQKKSHESKHSDFFNVLHLSSKFQSFRFNNKKNLKLNRSPNR